jgi:hypothetical protein
MMAVPVPSSSAASGAAERRIHGVKGSMVNDSKHTMHALRPGAKLFESHHRERHHLAPGGVTPSWRSHWQVTVEQPPSPSLR